MNFARPKDKEIVPKMTKQISEQVQKMPKQGHMVANNIVVKQVLLEYSKNEQLKPFYTALTQITQTNENFWDKKFYGEVVGLKSEEKPKEEPKKEQKTVESEPKKEEKKKPEQKADKKSGKEAKKSEKPTKEKPAKKEAKKQEKPKKEHKKEAKKSEKSKK